MNFLFFYSLFYALNFSLFLHVQNVVAAVIDFFSKHFMNKIVLAIKLGFFLFLAFIVLHVSAFILVLTLPTQLQLLHHISAHAALSIQIVYTEKKDSLFFFIIIIVVVFSLSLSFASIFKMLVCFGGETCGKDASCARSRPAAWVRVGH